MKHTTLLVRLALLVVSSLALGQSQSSAPAVTLAVPRLVKFSGVLVDGNGQPRSGVIGITFCLYRDQSSGAALWIETQNAQVDATGHYSVLLGATKPEGLDMELFSSGEARWLGVQMHGEPEQARILLLSVPYALKAGDAETLGGLSASAFMRAAEPLAAFRIQWRHCYSRTCTETQKWDFGTSGHED